MAVLVVELVRVALQLAARQPAVVLAASQQTEVLAARQPAVVLAASDRTGAVAQQIGSLYLPAAHFPVAGIIRRPKRIDERSVFKLTTWSP